MKVLITGANGFIAKNLQVTLNKMEHIQVLNYSRENSIEELENFIKETDFIFHLAGVNRPQDVSEFYEGNSNLTKTIVELIKKYNKKIPILFSSSSQVGNDNDYAKSKEEAERIIENYSKENDVNCFIYRLPNVFGKWSKPNYNTVIATWCHNITRDIDIQVNNEDTELTLVYIGDVIHAFISHLYVGQFKEIHHEIKTVYKKTLGEIKELLYMFKDSRQNLLIPNIAKGFERVLYATYLSFLPTDKFSYRLSGHEDARGTFYEILKTLDSGQLGISTTKPGITRGNHYHNTKNEKFLVIKGKALIELRDIYSKEIIQYNVDGNDLEIVEMIPGYTHNITNTGDEEMVLLIWANENYNPKAPDTNFVEV
ncbi:capsular biosynthesis protein [Malaciobacter marinus]|uniref:polysaccharide biosynthesis C-terminal domain-containing protein n=1 Tax=Malaciobacter marinus TaxID=505249 RepID=UPI000C0870AF|nr:NAD-dependent epimerase/dehydratase family protein [Malaciobacter marinus]PHO12859.1 capsular biosynthesis protein [Malaciobacter marinus]